MSQEIPVVFPTPQVNPQETSNSNSHNSNGSFGSVFIVLAIIIVISAIACFLGRLCSKKSSKGEKKHKEHKGKESKKQKQAFPKKEWEPKHNQTRDGDIEFGFDSKRLSSAKVAANNSGHDHPHNNPTMGTSRSFKGDHQMRFPGGGDATMMGPGGPTMMGPGGPMRFPGGDAPMMGPGGPMRFPGGDAAAAMGPSRSFRNGEFRGDQMRFPGSGGEQHMHRGGPVPY